MKLSEIHDKLDNLVTRTKQPLSRSLECIQMDLLELMQLLQATLGTTTKMMRELAEVQSLHNTVLETYRVKLEKLEDRQPFEVKPLRPFGGTHDA